MKPCTLCTHPHRERLDKALALRTTSPAAVARELGCHRASITRHVKNHLLPAVTEQVKSDPELQEVNILRELKQLYTKMKEHLGRAEQEDNWRAIRSFHAEARQDLELLAKLLGELQEGQTVNILVMPEWQAIRAAIISALRPFPQAQIAVAEALGRHTNGLGA